MTTNISAAHRVLWTRLASLIGQGTRLPDALTICTNETTEPGLKDALAQVARDIQTGATLHAAMARHPDWFSRVMVAIVHAGEVGGVLDVTTRKIADGLENGSCPLPGVPVPEAGSMVRFWGLLGLLLSSDVPLIHVFDLLIEEAETPRIRGAIHALRQAVAAGRTMAGEMAAFPDLFSEEVCAATALGEEKGDLDRQALRIADALKTGDLTTLTPTDGAQGDQDESRVTAFAHQLLLRAVERHASDIHIDPTDNGRGRIRLRVDGVLYEGEPVPEGFFEPLIGRVKAMAALDTAEHRLPQDGRVMFQRCGVTHDFRVSVVPSVRGERVVIRVLAQVAEVLQLSRIFPGEDLEKARGLCHLPHGIVLCCGPAGSGKTTLMYAMLCEIDREKNCVMSIEDPVEFRLEGVTQIQIRPQIGLTFARAAVAVLRQDPDAIMIGELRDLETTEIAVKCAVTGHLVFTQLHSNSSAGAVRRLLDMGVQPFLINASVAAVISQRLVRCLCPACKQPIDPPVHLMPPEAANLVAQIREGTFYGPKGCEACRGTGYKHRIAIHEMLTMDARLAQAISAAADVTTLHNAAVASGMRPLLACGLEHAARGVTSLEEVLRVVPSTTGL
jgi:general secretion pathway protein E